MALGQSRRAARAAAKEAARETAGRIAAQHIAALPDPNWDRAEDGGAAEFANARARARTAKEDARRTDRALAALADGKRLSQGNRGLRMILVAAVMAVALSWGGTLGLQYIQLLQVQELVRADQDALRVMCAVEPPTERDYGWLHICETAAGAAPSGQ